MLFDIIGPGQWWRHRLQPYAVWVHRLTRAVALEFEAMPKQQKMPWPTAYKQYPPQEQILNHSLYPKFWREEPRRTYRTSHLPRPQAIDCGRARIEIYAPGLTEDYMWRIRVCFAHPKPWEIEAWVDPGDELHNPFFREVQVRFALKAKVRAPVLGRADQWEGDCKSVQKLNRLAEATEPLQWITGAKATVDGLPPTVYQLPLTSFAACRYLPYEGAVHFSGLIGSRRPLYKSWIDCEWQDPRLWVERPNLACTIDRPTQVKDYYMVPRYLWRDTHNGFLATRAEAGDDPDQAEWDWPARRGRKPANPSTAMERLAAVVPGARLDPFGARESQLTVRLRPRAKILGVGVALWFARLTEAGIKYRRPPVRHRKRSWRQRLRDTVLYQPGLLTQLVRRQQAADQKWIRENGESIIPVTDRPLAPDEEQRIIELIEGKPAVPEAGGAGGQEPGAGGKQKKPVATRRVSSPAPDPRPPTPRASRMAAHCSLLTAHSTDFWITAGGFRLRIPVHFVPKDRHVPGTKTRFSEQIRTRGRPKIKRVVKKCKSGKVGSRLTTVDIWRNSGGLG